MAVPRSVIAEQVVRLTVQGADAVVSTVRSVVQRVAQAGQAAYGAVAKAASEAVSLSRAVAATGAAAIGYFTHAAMASTVEASNLSRAWELFGRVVGNEFAPMVRLVTVGVVRLTQAWQSLGPGTKAAVAGFAIVATAGASVVAVLPTIVSAVTALGPLFAALASPVGVAVGGFVALAAALSLSGEEGVSMGDRIASAIDGVVAGALRAKGLLEKFGAAIAYLYQNAGQAIKDVLTDGFEYAKVVFRNLTQLASKTAGNIARLIKNAASGRPLMEGFEYYAPEKFAGTTKTFQDLAKIMDDIDRKTNDAVRRNAGTGKAIVAGALGVKKELLDLLTRAGGANGFKLRMDVQFESFQGTFDRLQQAFAKGTAEDVMQQVARENEREADALERIEKKIADFARQFGIIGQ